MKSYSKFVSISLAMFALVFSFSFALAQDNDEVKARAQYREEEEVRVTSVGSSRIVAPDEDDGVRVVGGAKNLEKEGDNEKDKKIEDLNDGADDESVENANEDDGDRHERIMDKTLNRLNKIGDEVPGLGNEIREVARNEASSSAERVQAIHEVQKRSFLSKLFFGPDTEKISKLNDELKTTDATIGSLNSVKGKIASTTVRADLENQISALETARTSVEKFIKDNQDSFSFFGFFSKLFGGK